MLIAQITDLHIGPESLINDLNAQRLERVLDWIERFEPSPDLIIASGDLVDDGSASAYRKFSALLGRLNAPVLLALGNHDDRGNFKAAFPGTPRNGGFIQYAKFRNGKRIIVLDSVDENCDDGFMCDRRLAWLEEELKSASDIPTLIVLHHPPVQVGIGWMDPAAGLPWIAKLREIVAANPQIVSLISGHLHLVVSANFAGKPLSVANSTAEGLALDLRPIDLLKPDDRPMILDTSPALALHHWEQDFISHHVTIEQRQAVVRYNAKFQPTVRRLMQKCT